MEVRQAKVGECTLKFFFSLEFEGKRKVIEWCIENKLIASRYECPSCGLDMQLGERKDSQDGFEWRCRKKGANPHFAKRSVRTGTLFSSCKLSLIEILCMTRMWFTKCESKYITCEIGLSHQSVADWKSFCREICIDMCAKRSGKIGGENVAVEISESVLVRKRGAGRAIYGKWVYIGLERKSNKCFLRATEGQSKEVLLDIIRERVLPGSVVMSDCWQEYDCLNDEGFLNLGMTFKNREPELDNAEGTWFTIQKGLCGNMQKNFEPYLAEHLWRRSNDNSLDKKYFLEFLDCVKYLYPPPERDETHDGSMEFLECRMDIYPPRVKDEKPDVK